MICGLFLPIRENMWMYILLQFYNNNIYYGLNLSICMIFM